MSSVQNNVPAFVHVGDLVGIQNPKPWQVKNTYNHHYPCLMEAVGPQRLINESHIVPVTQSVSAYPRYYDPDSNRMYWREIHNSKPHKETTLSQSFSSIHPDISASIGERVWTVITTPILCLWDELFFVIGAVVAAVALPFYLIALPITTISWLDHHYIKGHTDPFYDFEGIRSVVSSLFLLTYGATIQGPTDFLLMTPINLVGVLNQKMGIRLEAVKNKLIPRVPLMSERHWVSSPQLTEEQRKAVYVANNALNRARDDFAKAAFSDNRNYLIGAVFSHEKDLLSWRELEGLFLSMASPLENGVVLYPIVEIDPPASSGE